MSEPTNIMQCNLNENSFKYIESFKIYEKHFIIFILKLISSHIIVIKKDISVLFVVEAVGIGLYLLFIKHMLTHPGWHKHPVFVWHVGCARTQLLYEME